MKYFKSIEHVHQSLIGQENLGLQGELLSSTMRSSTTAGREMLVRQLLSGDESESKVDDGEEPMSPDEDNDSMQASSPNAREQSPTKKRRTTADMAAGTLPPSGQQ